MAIFFCVFICLDLALGIKSLATPNYINPAQQQTTAGADVLGATNMNYQNQLADALLRGVVRYFTQHPPLIKRRGT
jgi:hypothetical protein